MAKKFLHFFGLAAYAVGSIGGKTEGHKVTFLDVDGTELKVEYVKDGGSATPPANPERTYCTFVEWVGDYTNVTNDVLVMPQYRSSDGNCHYEIDAVAGTLLQLTFSFSGTAPVIDWGDGTTATAVSGTNSHRYADAFKGFVTISGVTSAVTISHSQNQGSGGVVGYIDNGAGL